MGETKRNPITLEEAISVLRQFAFGETKLREHGLANVDAEILAAIKIVVAKHDTA